MTSPITGQFRDTRHAASRCPYCDYLVDGATSVVDATPSEGDWSVCLSCASVLVYGVDLIVRKPTVVELAELNADQEADEQIRSFQKAIRSIDRTGLG